MEPTLEKSMFKIIDHFIFYFSSAYAGLYICNSHIPAPTLQQTPVLSLHLSLTLSGSPWITWNLTLADLADPGGPH